VSQMFHGVLVGGVPLQERKKNYKIPRVVNHEGGHFL